MSWQAAGLHAHSGRRSRGKGLSCVACFGTPIGEPALYEAAMLGLLPATAAGQSGFDLRTRRVANVVSPAQAMADLAPYDCSTRTAVISRSFSYEGRHGAFRALTSGCSSNRAQRPCACSSCMETGSCRVEPICLPGMIGSAHNSQGSGGRAPCLKPV